MWPRPRALPAVNDAFCDPASPYSEIPAWTEPFNPSNSVSRMKFTTPATASEPYAADAPPVTTSTRETRLGGSALIPVAERQSGVAGKGGSVGVQIGGGRI